MTAAVAVRPLVPYPMTTVWLRTRFLQFWILIACRDRSVSTSRVVPMSTIRNSTRSGVTKMTLMKRADSLIGVMSP